MAKIKIVKLNRRYKLYKENACTHAIRFDGWNSEAGKLESFFRERYGSEYAYNTYGAWKSHWGKSTGHGPRPYYVGVKDEQMIFMAKLAGVV